MAMSTDHVCLKDHDCKIGDTYAFMMLARFCSCMIVSDRSGVIEKNPSPGLFMPAVATSNQILIQSLGMWQTLELGIVWQSHSWKLWFLPISWILWYISQVLDKDQLCHYVPSSAYVFCVYVFCVYIYVYCFSFFTSYMCICMPSIYSPQIYVDLFLLYPSSTTHVYIPCPELTWPLRIGHPNRKVGSQPSSC